MPNLKNKALVTMSEPVVNCAKPSNKPAKRAKKSKVSHKAESEDRVACTSFSRTLTNDVLRDVETPRDVPPTKEQPTVSGGKDRKEDVRKRPAFEETMGHLFGPDYAEAKVQPRRRWELDTYYALFGPDGQIRMSEKPRHYDVPGFRICRRKKPQEYTQVFGEPVPLVRRCSSPIENVTHDRLFGDETDDAASSESAPATPKSKIVQHWDVFEPYRGMKRRRQKHRRDATDTHGELFGQDPPATARKLLKNPMRFSRQTPKIVEDVMFEHLQPLECTDELPPWKTGKAFRRSGSPPRNPLTWTGYAAPSRESITFPDRGRQLKAAAEGVTVQESDRNPITGDGMPRAVDAIIVDPDGRKQRRSSSAVDAFVSQVVIADDLGPPSPSESGSRRPSDAHVRMFDHPRNPITGFGIAMPPSPVPSSDQATTSSSSVESPYRGRRHVQPQQAEPRRRILAWAKALGQVDDETCYIGDPPMIRRRFGRDDEVVSPITGLLPARAQLDGADDIPERLGLSPAAAAAQELDEDEDDDNDDDDDDDDDPSDDNDEVANSHVPVDRRHSA